MVRSIQVTKDLEHQVIISLDDEGFRIEGDPSASKASREDKTVCCCIPVPSGNAPDPTILPIDNLYVLNAYYLERNRTLHIDCLLPEDRSKVQSPTNIYAFTYDVARELEEEAKTFCQELKEQAYKDVKFGKSLLVLIDPKAGHKKAKKRYFDEVRPIFDLAKCEIKELYLERKGHALEIAEKLDIDAYDAIVTVSGDAVNHEVLNGFLKREDAVKVLSKVPLGIIPAGSSGNALSLSLMSGGTDAMYAALQVVKGKPLALDISSVTFDGSHRVFSFLTQHFGLAAATNYSSEIFGDFRDTFGLIPELISSKSYRVKASLQVESASVQDIRSNYASAFADASRHEQQGKIIKFFLPPLSKPVPDGWIEIEDAVSVFLASKVPMIAKELITHPYALPNDGTLDVLIVRGNTPFAKRMDVSNQLKDGQHLGNEIVEYYKVKAYRLEPIDTAELAIDGEKAPCKPFQVEVHPQLASILTIEPSFIRTHV